jgi:hypothetical protein
MVIKKCESNEVFKAMEFSNDERGYNENRK